MKHKYLVLGTVSLASLGLGAAIGGVTGLVAGFAVGICFDDLLAAAIMGKSPSAARLERLNREGKKRERERLTYVDYADTSKGKS